MRILSACIFSKSFGGKIETFSEATTYRNIFLENRRLHFWREN